MYSIDLGSLRISFAAALVSAPYSGINHDWLSEDWRDTSQELKIHQGERSATITGLTGFGAEKGQHVIHVIEPPIKTEHELLAYFLKKAEISKFPQEILLNAVSSLEYSWGKLVSLNWTALGYAPGGAEYCVLPTNFSAISLGFLRLDWPTVRVYPKA
ncbi:hypothetical protein K5Q02_10560 [Pseudomonas sp. MM211]|uniref:hypothetical protein n=1 Tax=Pseudomonas sp. MM211 TaxID=2866808 RepID=UPI001CEC8E85|nr:hypothetical protein [Pseudomonas sp. MM211]UCJ18772.1 hypothetical protein K5Q02_10560 [Pseudomonas sp. MM211]